jgi:hypothetical protein
MLRSVRLALLRPSGRRFSGGEDADHADHSPQPRIPQVRIDCGFQERHGRRPDRGFHYRTVERRIMFEGIEELVTDDARHHRLLKTGASFLGILRTSDGVRPHRRLKFRFLDGLSALHLRRGVRWSGIR